jgi:23S rRNA pseudouridine1911/1915/1917 synthase
LYLVRHGMAASRRQARSLIAAGHVRVNGSRWRKGRAVTAADVVELDAPATSPGLKAAPELPLDVLYNDAEFLVVNKPGLLPCHPLGPDDRPTLMNSVVARFAQAAFVGGNPLEGGLVHRLDNGTSGATMVALTQAGLERLRGALKAGQIHRRYVAVVRGSLKDPLLIDVPIAHHPRNRRKMIVVHDADAAVKLKARPALSAVTPLRRINDFTLVEVVPRTGRRHQIRVHLADAGFPLAGDELYGGPGIAALAPGRFFLHLSELRIAVAGGNFKGRIADPSGAQALVVIAPIPDDLSKCLEAMAPGSADSLA